jgi:predicted GNAT family N-acyltransferase
MFFQCIHCQTQKDIINHLLVRHEVFVEEINIPVSYETNVLDTLADLFLVYNERGIPIGAGRFRIEDVTGVIERISVIKNHRNQGIGEMIMKTIEAHALKQGVTFVELGAQLTAFSFYKRLNYEPFGEMYIEVGIEHKKMKKQLK